MTKETNLGFALSPPRNSFLTKLVPLFLKPFLKFEFGVQLPLKQMRQHPYNIIYKFHNKMIVQAHFSRDLNTEKNMFLADQIFGTCLSEVTTLNFEESALFWFCCKNDEILVVGLISASAKL